MTGRWVQENGFKHGKERWGLNQLDRRKVLDYAPDTIMVYHDTHYKTFVDTVRIACANVESDLASELAPHLNKKAEAKMALQNLFSSPGDIRVNGKSITIAIDPIGRKDEIEAFDKLLRTVNRWKLTLPGDSEKRHLRFETQN